MQTLMIVLVIGAAPALAEQAPSAAGTGLDTARIEELRGLRAALDRTTKPARAAASGVVFVCEHGSVKSLMAQEWFNRLARERGLAVSAVSRGVTPDSSVPPEVADALRRDGFDVSRFRPRVLDPSSLTATTHVVAMGVDPDRLGASAALTVERWDGIPPATQQYEAARDAIKARIEALLATLEVPARR